MELAPKNLSDLLAAVRRPSEPSVSDSPLASQFEHIAFLGWFTIDEATGTAAPSRSLMMHVTPGELEVLTREILIRLSQSNATAYSVSLAAGECWAFACRFVAPFKAIVACVKRTSPEETLPTAEVDIFR